MLIELSRDLERDQQTIYKKAGILINTDIICIYNEKLSSEILTKMEYFSQGKYTYSFATTLHNRFYFMSEENGS